MNFNIPELSDEGGIESKREDINAAISKLQQSPKTVGWRNGRRRNLTLNFHSSVPNEGEDQNSNAMDTLKHIS